MRDWAAFLRKRLDLPPMKKHRDERMIRELADHLEDLFKEALIRGASEDEAAEIVLRELGDTTSASGELIRAEPAHVRQQVDRWVAGREGDMRQKGGGWTSLADLLQDLRLALRSLTKSPLFTGVVVLVLALGIGGTTAIFTLVDGIVISPLPFDDPGALVDVTHTAPSRGLDDVGQAAAWHLTYEDENRVFEDIGMYNSSSAAVAGVGEPEALPVVYASSGVFRALRLNPVVGRIFTPDDEVPGAPTALLLSHGYWQTRFGGDRGAVGQTLQVDGATWEIAGVLPASLSELGPNPSLVLPMRFDRARIFVGNIGNSAVARLRDGVTLEQAAADLDRILPMAWENFPGGPTSSSSNADQYSPVLRPLKDATVGSVASLLWILLGGVGVVLLIACANVANLFLVRAEAKETEMAVRVAMGATRGRIGWEYMKESLLLGVLGGIAGSALAYGGLRALVAMAPTELPRVQQVSVSPSVLLFVLVVSLGTGALFGLLPGLRRGGTGLVDTLKQGGARGMRSRSRNRMQNALAMSQMALTLVLLVASGLMLRSGQALRSVDPGFGDQDDIQTLRLSIPSQEIADPEEMASTFERIARRLEQVPGVAAVGMANQIPMDGSNNVNPFYVDGVSPAGNGPPPSRRHNWVGEGFFETLQIPLLVGRTFTWDDVHNRFAGAILSESLAREYFGSPEAALGERVAARPEPVFWHEVVGVVADVRYDGVDQDPPAMVYWPQVTMAFWEGSPADQVQTWRGAGFAIRTARAGSPGLLADLREAIWEVNPSLPLRGVGSLPELMAASVARRSFTLTLLGVAAAVALLLGIVGVYGVISYAVSQRTRELGMRMALGAGARDLMRMVLRQGLTLSLTGVAIGLVLALSLTRVMAGLLYGVSPIDLTTFAVVATALTAVALTASYLPARRASKVDPVDALRG
jgi:putative ABC transport system permease protein